MQGKSLLCTAKDSSKLLMDPFGRLSLVIVSSFEASSNNVTLFIKLKRFSHRFCLKREIKHLSMMKMLLIFIFIKNCTQNLLCLEIYFVWINPPLLCIHKTRETNFFVHKSSTFAPNMWKSVNFYRGNQEFTFKHTKRDQSACFQTLTSTYIGLHEHGKKNLKKKL